MFITIKQLQDPYIATLKDTFVEGADPEPGVKHYVVLPVVNGVLFDMKAKVDYFINPKTGDSARTWWKSGMQHLIARVRYLVMDDIEEGFIGVFYHIQNNEDYLTFLGRLNPECELYEAALEKFKTHNYFEGMKV